MDDKLKQILEGSLSLFFKYGIRSISMDDIARELGISKKTIYYYFTNKNDLVKQILNHQNEKIRNAIEAIQNESLNAIDELLEISLEVSKHINQFSSSFSFDLMKYYPDESKCQKDIKNEYIFKLIKKNFEKGIKNGIYRSDLNSDLVAGLYVQRLVDMVNPDYIDPEKYSFSKIFQVVFESHIRGISNPEGIEYLETRKKQMKFNL